LVLAFMSGERQTTEIDDYVYEPHRSRGRAVRAGLMIGALSGPQWRHQAPFLSTRRYRFGGPGTTIRGFLTVAAEDMTWQPTRAWSIAGVAGLTVPWRAVASIEFIPRKVRRTVMVVSADDGSRLWLLVRSLDRLKRDNC
jgi:hypothetical protein